LYLLIKPYFIRIFLQNIYTPIVYDKKEQNYSTSIISLENSESSLPAQSKKRDVKPKGHKYTTENKILVLAFYKQSRMRAYSKLREFFALPTL
jgi:hypothetical protein